MRSILAALTGFALSAAPALAGALVTQDGKSYRGTIQLQAGNQVQLTPAEGDAITLPFPSVTRLSMVDEAPLAATPATQQSAALPAPWQNADVGRVHLKGAAAAATAGAFTLRGSGWGTWGAQDSCHFVFQPVDGDLDLVARLDKLPSDENRFLAGLTIRGGLAPDAAQVSLMSRPTDFNWHLNSRPAGGPTKAEPLVEAPQTSWVRLVRIGDSVSAFSSADGKAWAPLGAVNLKLSGPVVAGMACAALANETLAEARFDHVVLRTGPMGPPRGLALVDGSLLAAEVKQFDAQTLKYLDSAQQPREIATASVASIFTRPLPADGESAAATRPGVTLTSADFAEGEASALAGGKLTLVSLILGSQTLDWQQVARVSLRPLAPRGPYLVAARDGSVYRCKSVSIGDGVLTLQSSAAGEITLKQADLATIGIAK